MTPTDTEALRGVLRARVRGDVFVDPADRALYATDASNYRRVPLAVVAPRDVEDTVAAVAACREFGVALTPRGAGTSVAGNACGAGVVLDTRRYVNRVLNIDPDTRSARIEPGVVLDDLQAAAARFGLRFGPDPSTHSRCTLGGMIGNNACGSHSVVYGTTADNVVDLDVLLYDGTRLTVGQHGWAGLDALASVGGRRGEIHTALREFTTRHMALLRRRFPALPRRVSGYGLDHLLPERGVHVARSLVGSEGTCAVVLGATVDLVPLPAARVLLVLGYPDTPTAADAVPAILPHRPATVEGIDQHLVDSASGRRLVTLPSGAAWLLVELDGATAAEAVDRARALSADLSAPVSLVTDPAE
ncbi:MAG: FAD-binding oxidoreductase, partial [Kutzneria sp.]|nr:FAD-binding oxidoreductase [Kutzneria sp.]